jgi:cytochrome d ubiquinol oxidase subunit I
MRYALDVPVLGSLLLTHSWGGEVEGLNAFPADSRPPVAIPFFGFRVMVGIAVVMLAMAVVGQYLRFNGALDRADWYLKLCPWTAPLGFVAVIAGWMTTEVGRQPWTVYGLLRTAQSVTPSLTARDVAISLTLYILVYLVMYPTGIAFMAGIVRRGVGEASVAPAAIEAGLSAAPFVASEGE